MIIKALAIMLLIFGGIYFFFKYISKKLVNNFLKNMGVNPEAFQSQANQNNFNRNKNDEVIYQSGDTTISKGEAGKNK